MKKTLLWTLFIILAIELVVIGVFIGKKLIPPTNDQTVTTATTENIMDTTTMSTDSVGENDIELENWIPSDTPISFPILMYHSLEIATDGNSLKIPPAEFKEHMTWLKDNGYYTLTPDEAYLVLTENKKPAENIVWVTFDDGYANNYTEAYPILKELELKGTINYITSKLEHPAYFHEPELKEMAASDTIAIESHTVSHLDLNSLDDTMIRSELAESKQWLDTQLNQETAVICYPAGRYDERVERIAEEVGYKMALTTEPGYASSKDGLFALKRVRVSPGYDSEQFGDLLQGAH